MMILVKQRSFHPATMFFDTASSTSLVVIGKSNIFMVGLVGISSGLCITFDVMFLDNITIAMILLIHWVQSIVSHLMTSISLNNMIVTSLAGPTAT